MEIRSARKNESTKVIEFYYDMIEKMQASEYRPTWKMGVYPTEEYLASLVQRGQVFIGLENGLIVGAMALNHDCNESYSEVNWSITANKHEVTILHLLSILPECGGRGCGMQMLDFAKHRAAQEKQKSIRLDVMGENLPAIRLYEAAGFSRIETLRMFYESTGWSNFVMYEYEIPAHTDLQ